VPKVCSGVSWTISTIRGGVLHGHVQWREHGGESLAIFAALNLPAGLRAQ